MEEIIIQINIKGEWQDCCLVKINEPKRSRFSKSSFEFNIDYFFQYAEFESSIGLYSPSVRLELNLTSNTFSHWPSFLLDMIPQGAARKIVCQREKILDNEESDFEILTKGAINPIGNLRIKNNQNQLFQGTTHAGFDKKDLLEKNENFLEHAEKYHAIIVGTSGAQGVAPKFLLNTDEKGKWHCDGALKDSEIAQSFLVKLPRGKTHEDILILEAEKAYMEIAHKAQVNANTGLFYEDKMLFIPRFDRVKKDKKIIRFGMESLSSAAGQFDLGVKGTMEEYLKVIAKYSSSPKEDILEFIRRDFLNIVMGNTDNHARNTAFLKTSENEIRLSPLFDFAPMVMDSDMIARATKWEKEEAYIPSFSHINKTLKEYQFNEQEIEKFFKDFLFFLKRLPELFKEHELKEEVIEKATRKYIPFLNTFENFIEGK